MCYNTQQQTLVKNNLISYCEAASHYKVKQANAIRNGKIQKQPREKEIKSRSGFDNFCKTANSCKT